MFQIVQSQLKLDIIWSKKGQYTLVLLCIFKGVKQWLLIHLLDLEAAVFVWESNLITV